MGGGRVWVLGIVISVLSKIESKDNNIESGRERAQQARVDWMLDELVG